MHMYMCICVCVHVCVCGIYMYPCDIRDEDSTYGVATISRLLKIKGLFCRI